MGEKKKLSSGIIKGFSRLLHFFWRSSPTVQSTFFLLQRSFNATTLHNPQVSKGTPTHALNDPKALNWSQVLCLHSLWGDHKPSPCFAFPQPALIFQHLVYWCACSRAGSKSMLLPRVTPADGHETKKEVSVTECSVVTTRVCPGSLNPLQDLYWQERGDSKTVTLCPRQKLCTLSILLENLLKWSF